MEVERWKTVYKEVWRRDKCIELSKLAQNRRIFVSYVNAHLRATTAEMTFNNQRDSMTQCVDVSQPLSPGSPFRDQCAYDHNGHNRRDEDCALIKALGYSLY